MKHKFPRVLGSQDLLIILPYLKLTFSHLKMDAWKMILSFLGLKGQFLRCQLAVSFRDATCFQQHFPPPKQPDLHLIKHNCWTPRHWWYSQGRCGWSAFCCLSLSSSENHGGWNHMLVRRKANILADCCHSFKKSWTLYLQLVPSSYHWTFLLAWSWSQGCQGSVPLLYRCTQDLYETKLRNPQVGDSYWKLPRLEIYGQTHTSKLRLFQVWSQNKLNAQKGWRIRTEAGKVPLIPSMLPTNLSPWNLREELPDCHPDTSKGGDLLRFDNSETLPSGKVT